MPPLLRLEDLSITYATRAGDVPAVRGVSLTIGRGEAYGLVGESGCGKTSVAMAIMAYLGRNGRVAGGRVLFDGEDLGRKSDEALRALRGRRIAMVYQDPLASLNPCLTVGEQLSEVLTVHQGLGGRAAWAACHAMLERVRMPELIVDIMPVLGRAPRGQEADGVENRVPVVEDERRRLPGLLEALERRREAPVPPL
ncbi:MAG: ATP-binding cassette domain-containing protein, partial [Chloroflexi bacterium]|nr:ATP-binding cassette domain-containing protein [Chloroflexota bacterium]